MEGREPTRLLQQQGQGVRLPLSPAWERMMTGKRWLDGFREDGIHIDQISLIPGVPTGTALILVDRNGENSIAVAPGANNHLSNAIIDRAEALIKETDLILLQLEIPYDTIQHICKLASRHQKRIILNPAPARELDEEVLGSLEYLVLNETEAEIISRTKSHR